MEGTFLSGRRQCGDMFGISQGIERERGVEETLRRKGLGVHIYAVEHEGLLEREGPSILECVYG